MCRGRRIHALSQIQQLRILLRPQRRQHSLRRKRRFMQPHTNRIVDRIRDRRDGCGQRPFAAFFGAERAFGIDAFDDDRLDFRRFDRRRAAIFEQAGVHQHAVLPDHFLGKGLPHAHPDRTDNLAFDGNGIECASTIVRGPDFVNRHFAGVFSTVTSATCAEYEYAGDGPTPAPLCLPPRASGGGAYEPVPVRAPWKSMAATTASSKCDESLGPSSLRFCWREPRRI